MSLDLRKKKKTSMYAPGASAVYLQGYPLLAICSIFVLGLIRQESIMAYWFVPCQIVISE